MYFFLHFFMLFSTITIGNSLMEWIFFPLFYVLRFKFAIDMTSWRVLEQKFVIQSFSLTEITEIINVMFQLEENVEFCYSNVRSNMIYNNLWGIESNRRISYGCNVVIKLKWINSVWFRVSCRMNLETLDLSSTSNIQ